MTKNKIMEEKNLHNKDEKEGTTRSEIRNTAEQYYKKRFPKSLSFDSEIIFAFEFGVEWIINKEKENGRR
jgi:hypothetical protein